MRAAGLPTAADDHELQDMHNQLVLTPACMAQQGTATGKQAFQGVVQSEARSFEARRAAAAARTARDNFNQLSEVAAMDGNPAAWRAANYSTRQATPAGASPSTSTFDPMP